MDSSPENDFAFDDGLLTLTKLHVDQQTHQLRAWALQSTFLLALIALYSGGVDRGIESSKLLVAVVPIWLLLTISFLHILYKHQDRLRQISLIMQARSVSVSHESRQLVEKFGSDSPLAVLALGLISSVVALVGIGFIHFASVGA